MRVNLTIDNKDKIIEFHYKKVKGNITIKFIDDDTGEVIKTKILSDLELGTHNIKPTEIEGYKFVGEEIVEEIEEDEEDYDEEYDEDEIDDDEYDEEIEEDDDEIEELEDDELDSIKKFVDGLSGKDGK
jgi:hypothetical protein